MEIKEAINYVREQIKWPIKEVSSQNGFKTGTFPLEKRHEISLPQRTERDELKCDIAYLRALSSLLLAEQKSHLFSSAYFHQETPMDARNKIIRAWHHSREWFVLGYVDSLIQVKTNNILKDKFIYSFIPNIQHIKNDPFTYAMQLASYKKYFNLDINFFLTPSVLGSWYKGYAVLIDAFLHTDNKYANIDLFLKLMNKLWRIENNDRTIILAKNEDGIDSFYINQM